MSIKAFPVFTATLAAVALGVIARVVDVRVLAAAVVGMIVVLLIRVYPMVTLFSLAASRATIEALQTKNVIRVAGIALSPTDLISIAFLGGVALTLYSELRAGNEFWKSPMMLAAGAFMGFALISLGYSESIGEGARGLVKWGSAFGAYALIQADRPDIRRLKLLLALTVGSAVIPLLWGAYQLANSVGRQNLLHGGLRIQSTFNHPNDYGFYLVVVLVAIWGLHNVTIGLQRRLVDAIAIAAIGSVALTLSRSAYAALVIVVFVVGMRRKRLLIGLSAVGTAIILAAPRVLLRVTDLINPREGDNTGNSLLGRLEIWSGEFELFRQRPFLGHGWGYTLASQEKASHNDYLRLMVEGGIVGLVTIVALMGSLLRAAWTASRRRVDLPRAYLGLAIGYVIDSAVTNTIGKGAFQFYFWLMTAIALRWATLVPPDGETESADEPEPDLAAIS